MKREQQKSIYRGRIAPTPTGYLHLGHASTFHIAEVRAREAGGTVIFRNEDLDKARCKQEFIDASIKDLKDIGLTWDEGPDIGGDFGPYSQSERMAIYKDYWKKLLTGGFIYPCSQSRKGILESLSHHSPGEEIVFPSSLRPSKTEYDLKEPGNTNWRFRIPDGESVAFHDNRYGKCSFTAGKDFGDFLIWRKDGFPSYELAVVVDDHEMQITEVVRGEDLLMSTARQILLYRSLQIDVPDFYHCGLLTDELGNKLAKRHKSLSLRELINSGNIAKINNILKKAE